MTLPIQRDGAATSLGTHRDAHAVFRLSVASGDERLAIDPLTGRNRYGVPPGCAPGEVWFASSTASPVSDRAYEATIGVLDRLLARHAHFDPSDWSQSIRSRIQAAFGIAGSDVILTGSGTEAELIVVALARAVLKRRLTSVVVAPHETGSGVVLAAEGRHFLDSAAFSSDVHRGRRLDGIEAGSIAVAAVDIRSPDGVALEPAAVDTAVLSVAEPAIAAGRGVVLHCLDCSKTGLSGFARATAATFRADHEDRCLVVVDACQLRCTPEQIRQDLRNGFIVAITGSKFAGGPPFCGALLLPPDLIGRLRHVSMVEGLAAYTAAQDWPVLLREGLLGQPFGSVSNLPLYTRWEAALTELQAYGCVDDALRRAIIAAFGQLVEETLDTADGLDLVAAPPWERGSDRTIFPVLTDLCPDASLSVPAVYRSLRESGFHVGQPVKIGSAEALRICLSMPQIVDIAARTSSSGSLTAAMAPVAGDLHDLVARWSALRAAPSRRRS